MPNQPRNIEVMLNIGEQVERIIAAADRENADAFVAQADQLRQTADFYGIEATSLESLLQNS